MMAERSPDENAIRMCGSVAGEGQDSHASANLTIDEIALLALGAQFPPASAVPPNNSEK